MDRHHAPIYHSNVMMSVGRDLSVVCLQALPDEGERLTLGSDAEALTDAQIEAAVQTVLQALARHFAAGESFAFETTLSGRGYVPHIQAWQAAGYAVKLLFLKLDSPEEAIARVAQRVLQGGHDIPEATIRRRFAAGLHNFEHLYAPLVDAWALYDNAGSTPLLLDWSEKP